MSGIKYNIRTVAEDNIQSEFISSEDNILKAVDTACNYYNTHELKAAVYINNSVNPVFTADELAKYVLFYNDTVLYVLPNMNDIKNILDNFENIHPDMNKNNIITYRAPLTEKELQTLTQYFVLSRINADDEIIPDDDKFTSEIFCSHNDNYAAAVEKSKTYPFRTGIVSMTAINQSDVLCSELIYISDENTDINDFFRLEDNDYTACKDDKIFTPDEILADNSLVEMPPHQGKFVMLYKNRLVTNLEINLRQGFFRLYDSENITSRKISAQKFFINYLHNHFEDVSFVLQKHNVIL